MDRKARAGAMSDASGGLGGLQPHEIVAHLASAFAIVGTFIGLLPSIAAGVAILWYAVQVYESHTVQQYIKKRRRKKSLRRRKRREGFARLKARFTGR